MTGNIQLADGESLLRLWYWLSTRRDRTQAERALLRRLADELVMRGVL
jgi:hypothetical protein